jgi:hypothetical protein
LGEESELTKSILGAPNSPDTRLVNYKKFFDDEYSKKTVAPPVKLQAVN